MDIKHNYSNTKMDLVNTKNMLDNNPFPKQKGKVDKKQLLWGSNKPSPSPTKLQLVGLIKGLL